LAGAAPVLSDFGGVLALGGVALGLPLLDGVPGLDIALLPDVVLSLDFADELPDLAAFSFAMHASLSAAATFAHALTGSLARFAGTRSVVDGAGFAAGAAAG
jgi:hypothetical protein